MAVDDGGRTAASGLGYMSGNHGAGYTDESLGTEVLDRLDMHSGVLYGRAHVVWVTAMVPLPPEEVQGEVEQ